MIRLLFLILITVLASCGASIQTTSGEAYLANSRGPVDPEIRKLAAIEPDLRFPARIGVARLVNGQLSVPSETENDLLGQLIEKHSAMGDWVAVSPLIDGMVNAGRKIDPVQRLRRAAARQHLDYVLIYEAGARSKGRQDTPFALADVTILGGLLLPTRVNHVTGIGVATFLDTRNGYPYGHAHTSKDLSGLARSWVADRAQKRLQERAINSVAASLMPEIDKMLTMLRTAEAGS